MCHVFIFVGPRGAAGASFVALNVASALATQGYRSVLLNADRTAGSTWERVGARSGPSVHDLAWGYCRAEELFMMSGNGVEVVNLGDTAAWSGADGVCRLIPAARTLADRDFLLVDMPLDEIERCPAALRTAGQVFAVVSEEQAAGFAAHRFLVNLHLFNGTRPLYVVLNRVHSRSLTNAICDRLEHDFRKILGVDLRCTAWIPEEPREAEAEAARVPLATFASDSEASLQICRLATRMMRMPGLPVDEHALHNLLTSLVSDAGSEMDMETVPFKENAVAYEAVHQSSAIP